MGKTIFVFKQNNMHQTFFFCIEAGLI